MKWTRRDLMATAPAWLLPAGLGTNRTALQAIGYRQVMEHLQGVRGRRETIELVKVRTRQFAKRQTTWFRGQLDLDWLEVGAAETPQAIVERILQRISVDL